MNLKNIELFERDDFLRKELHRLNSWIENKRNYYKKFNNSFQQQLFEGMIFPFSEKPDSNQVIF